jgi:hypothetical protein
MFYSIIIALAMLVVAIRTASKIIRTAALVAAALVGCAVALKVFVHAVQWAVGSLFAVALVVTLVWFMIKKDGNAE